MNELRGQRFVLCGVGRGLGGQIAKLILEKGGDVVLGSRNTQLLQEIRLELGAQRNDSVVVLPLDLSDEASVTDFCSHCEELGSIRGVAVIGARHQIGGLYDHSRQDWREIFESNVIGPVSLVKALIDKDSSRDEKSIVLVGSQAAVKPSFDELAYAASKGALLTAGYYLAEELGDKGVRVNSILPSWMKGPALQAYAQSAEQAGGPEEEQFYSAIAEKLPLKQIAADSQVARVAVFLLSDDSSGMTGQSVLVNSGEFMR